MCGACVRTATVCASLAAPPVPVAIEAMRIGADHLHGAIPKARMSAQSTSGGYGGTQPPE
jgi:hypothetical protein